MINELLIGLCKYCPLWSSPFIVYTHTHIGQKDKHRQDGQVGKLFGNHQKLFLDSVIFSYILRIPRIGYPT